MRRLLLATLVTLVCAAAGGAGWFARLVKAHHADVRQYQQSHAPDKIVGQTAGQILSTYGEPFMTDLGPDARPQFIMYKQVKRGQYCTIVLKDGVAVEVSFSFQ